MTFNQNIIHELKNAIISSRYQAARLVNRELIILYFRIGVKISESVLKEAWGSKVLDKISSELQKELPGLRGFSGGNLKKMRVFSGFWMKHLKFSSALPNQCLVAFELKTGKFKPEYLGKLNFYLSALDDLIKQPHENASIGIVLCKEKNNKIVEYSFRDFNKAMGVATYKTSDELPESYRELLPDAETLKKLLD
jgi:predicted nuclease of restriction endonuclease-like (RecB) superfamily